MKKPEDAHEGEWDFDGACAPAEGSTVGAFAGQQTFTLGCFQWVRRGKDGQGKGLKKGKVVYRIKGDVADSASAYERARAHCAKRNVMQARLNGTGSAPAPAP